MSNVQYTGHLADGSGIQAHSAGPDYPGVVYGREYEGDPRLYWGAIIYGFNWGVFVTQAHASECIRLVKAVWEATRRPVNLMSDTQRAIDIKATREALADHLDAHRAARDGVRPDPFNWLLVPADDIYVLSGMTQERLPVDDVRTPIQMRQRWGVQADAMLAFFGFDPRLF